MKINEFGIPGVFLIENSVFSDERGRFIKTFSDEFFKDNNISFCSKEIYYSISHKNVIRGMHFQTPRMEHAKLIYLTSGEIIDVVLDLRKKSPTFGKSASIKLSADNKSLFVPVGCAHGFKSLHDYTVVVYNQTSCYSKEHDSGILWNSFGFDWEIDDPIMSERDKSFTSFNNFSTPF
jgi:dTDP-4-dehydrorhamnose 3,5-epimerase